jgi:TonB family protein
MSRLKYAFFLLVAWLLVLPFAHSQDANGPFHPGTGGVTYPKCDYCPDPEYTKEARKKHLEGKVVVQGVVQTNGRITDITVVKSPNSELARMAVDTVGKWRFKPAQDQSGNSVPTTVPIEIVFRLLK